MTTVPFAVKSSQWRASGLCSQCGREPAAGRRLCELHAAKADRAHAARKRFVVDSATAAARAEMRAAADAIAAHRAVG